MNRRFGHDLPLIGLLALSLGGCFYPAERGKMLEERVERLEADKKELQAALQKQKERLEAQIPRLDEQVLEVGRALEKLDKAARRTGADMGVQLEQMQAELSQLRGQLEEQLHKLSMVEAALAQLKESGGQPAPAKAEDGSVAVVEARPVKEEVVRPADKKAFADLVADKLASEPELGRKLADEWLKKWPKDPLAARVHLALGNSHRVEKGWRAALAEYRDIILNFDKSGYAPDALLHSSECFAALKMEKEAELALEEILNSYPKSDAAKLAKPKLAEMRKAKGKKGK